LIISGTVIAAVPFNSNAAPSLIVVVDAPAPPALTLPNASLLVICKNP
jgi:hypothetical protein